MSLSKFDLIRLFPSLSSYTDEELHNLYDLDLSDQDLKELKVSAI